VKFKIALSPKPHPAPKVVNDNLPLEADLFKILSVPMTSEEAREKLKANKSDFTRAINRLITNNKIKRSTESKKNWERADSAA
jgi:predicted HTH transcriptional regulator